MRLVLVHLLVEQQRVRAEIDELLPLQDLRDDLRHLAVQQRLAAGDGDDGGAALVDGLQRVGNGQALVQDLGRVVDLAAAGARQVAAEERLQHQHQRVALTTAEMLLDDIGADPDHLLQRNRHLHFSLAAAIRGSLHALMAGRCPRTCARRSTSASYAPRGSGLNDPCGQSRQTTRLRVERGRSASKRDRAVANLPRSATPDRLYLASGGAVVSCRSPT